MNWNLETGLQVSGTDFPFTMLCALGVSSKLVSTKSCIQNWFTGHCHVLNMHFHPASNSRRVQAKLTGRHVSIRRVCITLGAREAGAKMSTALPVTISEAGIQRLAQELRGGRAKWGRWN